MLIRLFFGIPLTKELAKTFAFPLTLTTFKNKEYIGIYSPAVSSLLTHEFTTHFHFAKQQLEKVLCEYYFVDKEDTLIVFPEILIG
ncbi:hypothetical protein BOKEGFJH_00907 [Chlamydia avium]|uniref:Uncharacterized protein n=1 Tax=Chlamydia avium TaxID=1457141 RepID=A0ABN0MT37_9CHLA|nr:hypothetical protein [Chlamydia avium]EPP36537.1 hypothetical protein CP10743SC13_0278 [Chlamydia psittaci 10_743_SC13]EPP38603.1 hypothetical protein CP10881SC42_0366 [Chlamydia avium]VVT43361.1 hypothetical protein BOKEGFJH_00907 [Chlamydia avium]